MNAPKVSVLVRLTERGRKRLRLLAARRGQTQSAVIETALLEPSCNGSQKGRGKHGKRK